MRSKFIFSCVISLSATFFAGCIRTYCGSVEVFRKRTSCAIVTKKYRVEWNRNEPRLDITDHCGDVKGFKITGDDSGLFDYVEVGDSLYKASNSFRVYVYRNGTEKPKIFDMDFGCN